METTTFIVGALAVAAVLALALLLMGAARGKRRFEDVPPAMRPGYSDDQLEKTVIERYMTWGLILTVFLAIFLPAYWLREPARQSEAREQAFISQVVRGGDLYAANCSECHGNDGGGGAATSPYDPDSVWPAPNLRNIVTRYEDNQDITDIERFVDRVLHEGRSGTPMPPWGVDYQGPLTDEEIEAITAWILNNQDDPEGGPEEGDEVDPDEEVTAEGESVANLSGGDLYAQNCAKCHGDALEGRTETRAPRLTDVFDRHTEASILGVLQNGIQVSEGANMPPWQVGYMYEGTRFSDDTLQRIIDFLAENQDDGVDLDGTTGDAEAADEALPDDEGEDAEDDDTDETDDESDEDSAEA